MSQRERYTVLISRDEDGRITSLAVHATDLEGAARTVVLEGAVAARIAGAVHEVLRGAGLNGRTWSGRAPIALDAVVGAQVELLLRAVKPLRRSDRIEEVSGGVAAMSREEACYWHAKTHRPGGLRAIRELLGAGADR